ncbi:hypothetical protein Tco_0844256 [Tanacetum coccineum]
MESSVSNTEERESQQLQERHTKTRKDCSVYFELIKKHSKYLQTIRWNGWGAKEGFSRAIRRYFGDNRDTFSKKLSYNIDHFQRQIEKVYLHKYDERARVDKVVSDVENVVARPSYDNNTLIEVHHSNNDTFENVFALEIQNHERLEVKNCKKVNREAQQANASLTKELEIFMEKENHFAKEKTNESCGKLEGGLNSLPLFN